TEIVHNRPFQITADRPGVYRIAIALFGDVNFTGLQTSPFGGIAAFNQYTLNVTNVGNIALGGFRLGNSEPIAAISQAGAGNELMDTNQGVEVILVDNGDIGGVTGSGNYHLDNAKVQVLESPQPGPPPPTFPNTYSLRVANGNLRSLNFNAIGMGDVVARLIVLPGVSIDFTAPDIAI